MLGPGINQHKLISTGNETLDKFLAGGLRNSTLNLFKRQGPSSRILDVIINKSISATTLCRKQTLLYVNLNGSISIEKDEVLAGLPSQRKVKSELLYRDIRGESATTKIKIAWRYSDRSISSPTDGVPKVEQVDFGVPLMKTVEEESLGILEVINYTKDESMTEMISAIINKIDEFRSTSIVMIIKDLLHPFSRIIEGNLDFLNFMYAMRCLARSLKEGAIIVSYDLSLCQDYSTIEQQLFNIADSVVSFHSYETDENLLTGYKDIDGTVSQIKVPRLNPVASSLQQELSDWGYRLTKNNRFFVVDELSLPPSEND